MEKTRKHSTKYTFSNGMRESSKGRIQKSQRPLILVVAAIFLLLIIRVQSTSSTSLNVTKARKYIVTRHFQGIPKRSDYEIVEYELPPLKDGEILVKSEWISVDPYMRILNPHMTLPYDQLGFQVGTVIESRDVNYSIGSRVVSHSGWNDYSVINTTKLSLYNPVQVTYQLPDLGGISPSLAIGTAGMPGVVAYFGLLDICKPKEGETVVVTGAAGAIGSVVGQIAKIKGCKVIGFAGSEDKVKWLENELGFDKAINYKTADIQKALQAAAPNGVDCYFDNVGGEISSIIISQMNNEGRVAVSGSISSYNDKETEMPKATILQPSIFSKQLEIKGFLVQRWYDRRYEAINQLITWLITGQLKPKEYITFGFDNIFDAFVDLFHGKNIGKAIVKI